MPPRRMMVNRPVLIALVGLSIGGARPWVLTGSRLPSGTPEAWTAPRMPWGHPDLQGIWDSKTITPVQRPENFAGREFLTDEEVAVLEREAVQNPCAAK